MIRAINHFAESFQFLSIPYPFLARADASAPVNTVLAAFRRVVDEEEAMADMRQVTTTAASSGAGPAGGAAGGKKRTGPGGSGSGNGDRELLSVRELSHATEEIKAFFDVPQLAAVMPLCRRCARVRSEKSLFQSVFLWRRRSDIDIV
jgi:hypothetical protein